MGRGCRQIGQENLADQQRASLDPEHRAAAPDGVRRLGETGERLLVQTLAGHDAGNFDRAAVDAGVGEQHLTQRARSQLGQPAAPAAQGPRRDQASGEDPGSFIAQQLHLAGPGPGGRAQAQDARLVAARTSPALTQHLSAESAPSYQPEAKPQVGVHQQGPRAESPLH